ncbi:hypothetical protein [Streptacidiphilus cavernicola]|uniref:Uncharacterized protein n=1 Tax=Streptacidiphilus cavernicola TaxID=3342716 RepID=A0ABV6VYE9_9ACTN
MAKYRSGPQPRIACPGGCEREVAAREVIGAIGMGAIVDHKSVPGRHELTLCPGTGRVVELPAERAHQHPIPRLMHQLRLLLPEQINIFDAAEN